MRESISKSERFEVFKRDRFTCQYCGRRPPDVILHLDHILAVSKGGSNDRGNLLTSCQDCNLGKSNKSLSRIDAPLNFDVEGQQEKLDQIRAYSEHLLKENEYYAECEDQVIEFWCQKDGQKKGAEFWYYPPQLEIAVKQFVKRLTLAEIFEAIIISFGKFPRSSDFQKFRYFCGVCWKKIRDRNPQKEPPCT